VIAIARADFLVTQPCHQIGIGFPIAVLGVEADTRQHVDTDKHITRLQQLLCCVCKKEGRGGGGGVHVVERGVKVRRRKHCVKTSERVRTRAVRAKIQDAGRSDELSFSVVIGIQHLKHEIHKELNQRPKKM
jgi:hypothetical protein